MKPCLILDLDGTLVDSLPGIAGSLNRSLAAHDLPTHSESAVRTFIGNGIQMLVKRGAPHDASDELIGSILDHFKKDYEATWREGTKPYIAIPPLLKDLQRDGYQLAVLSNKVHRFTQTMCREIFPYIHFTAVVGQQDGVPHKPHPSGALKIALSMGVDPKDCLFVGDSTTDIETAHNAEMPSVAVCWGYHDRDRLIEAEPTHLIDDASGLLKILRDFE